jgi:polar amino acid transport system ATP-binding protein
MNIELSGLAKRYGETQALRGIDLKVEDPIRVLALIGPSGGGKSTLLRLLGGLESADAGTVVIDGETLVDDEPALLKHRRSNGYLFQAFNLFPHFTALENVMLPLTEVHGKEKADARATAMNCLERFGLADHATKRPAEMSGGQQQRVALARAIAIRPRLLLLDEPTSALDPEMTAEVLELIEELCRGGQEIVLSTHEMGFAKAVADEVVFLADGQLVERGAAAEIFENPKSGVVENFLSRVMRY